MKNAVLPILLCSGALLFHPQLNADETAAPAPGTSKTAAKNAKESSAPKNAAGAAARAKVAEAVAQAKAAENARKTAPAPVVVVPAAKNGDEMANLGAEPVSITAGEKRMMSVPFDVEFCKSNSSNVKIEQVGGNAFEITGVTPGKAVITVLAGGIEKKYDVTVFNSTLQTYQELSRLLEELPEVTLELRDNGLSLRGTIAIPGHWTYYRRIIAPFAGRCHDYVAFLPDATLIESLKRHFIDAGFPIVKKADPQDPGKLALNLNGRVLSITGHLLSDADIKNVEKIIAAHEWLNPDWNGNNFRANVNLAVAPCQIDLGIVFVGVNRTQLERLGNSSADGTVLTWDVVGWFKALYGGSLDAFSSHGSQHIGGSAVLQTPLKGSLLFFGNNGITDFRDAGHITLTNNSKQESTFENGGTRSVMVYGQESADLKEIEFGLKYKAKAQLLENNMVRLDLDLERSLPPVRDDKDYVQRKTKTKTSLMCPLGKTAVIAGQKELSFAHNGPSGYAFLRHIPIINWFASFKEDTGEEVQILILVAPQLMNPNVKMATRPSEETAGLEPTVTKKVSEQQKEVLKKEELPWYRKIFSW